MVHRFGVGPGGVLAGVALAIAAGAAVPPAGAQQPPKDPPDPFVGEYAGTYTPADGKPVPAVGWVVLQRRGRPDGAYRVTLKAVASGLIQKTVVGPGAKVVASAALSGKAEGGKVALSGKGWTGELADGRLTASAAGGKYALQFTVRKSPTELKPPPRGAIVLLGYKPGEAPSLAEWSNTKWPAFEDGSILVRGGDNRSKRKFTNFRLHAEFRVPVRSDGGGNSGFYLLDRYEVQVLDTFGGPPAKSGCGAIYQTFPPRVNAALPAGRWQTYDIEFYGPVMEAGKAIRLPVITVVHNGILVHKEVVIPQPTGHARPLGHGAPGPIRLQDHHNPVRFRNIWVEKLPESTRPTGRRAAASAEKTEKATARKAGPKRPADISRARWLLLERERRGGKRPTREEFQKIVRDKKLRDK